MLIHGDRSKPIYEVKLDRLNLLTGKYERCWDYVHAENADEAKSLIQWIYGSGFEILSVEIDV